MAAVQTTDPTGTTTEDGFLADRMNFWDRFTGFTLKVTASLIFFCAWLWWATFAGFSLLHVLVLPVVVVILMLVL
jgi:hypothetical protein